VDHSVCSIAVRAGEGPAANFAAMSVGTAAFCIPATSLDLHIFVLPRRYFSVVIYSPQQDVLSGERAAAGIQTFWYVRMCLFARMLAGPCAPMRKGTGWFRY